MIVICYVWIGRLRQYNNNFGVIYGHSFPSKKKIKLQQYNNITVEFIIMKRGNVDQL